MVTIILEAALISSVIVPLATTTALRVSRWMERRRRNALAKECIARFDNLDGSFANVLESARQDSARRDAIEATAVTSAVLSNMGVAGVTVESACAQKAAERMREQRGWIRIRNHRLTELAFSAADEAYNEFGARSLSKANDLVTRKFLRDFFRECKDLRTKDANRAIEIALPFSYLPPAERGSMQEFVTLDPFVERVGPADLRVQ